LIAPRVEVIGRVEGDARWGSEDSQRCGRKANLPDWRAMPIAINDRPPANTIG